MDQIPPNPPNPPTKKKNIDALDPEPLISLFTEFKNEINKMGGSADSIEVLNEETYSNALEMAIQAKTILKTIEDKRKEVTEPYKKIKRLIDSECKKLKDSLMKIKVLVEQKTKPFLIEMEKRRKDALHDEEVRISARQQTLNEEYAKRGETAPLIVSCIPDKYSSGNESGYQTLETSVTWEIEDFHSIPIEAFTTREKQVVSALSPWINLQIKAGITQIPGVMIYEKTDVKTKMRR